MRFTLLYSFLLLYFTGAAQNDSLLFELMHTGKDTERVNQIYQAGFTIRHSDPEMAYRYAVAAETEALKSGSKKHLAKSYNLKGILHYKKGDYTRALSYQHKALQLNEAAGFIYGIAINQTNLGNIYSDMDYADEAEAAYLKALKAYNALSNRGQIVSNLMNLGVLKYKQKHRNLAIRYFRTALSMATEDNDIAVMASCNNNIGAVLMEENIPDSALIYLEEGLKLLDMQDNVIETADVYNNMGMSFIKKKELQSALNCLRLADSISRLYDYTDARLHVYESYAMYYEAQQDYRQANLWLKKHYQLKDSILLLSRKAMDISLVDDLSANSHPQGEKLPEPAFRNGWILVILGAFAIGVPLFLIRYKR